MGKYIDFLRGSDLFNNLFQTQLEMIESVCHECHYQSGEMIFEENTSGTELYLVLDGKVEIVVSSSELSLNNKKNHELDVIATMERGQSFGEITLVDQGLRSAGARSALKNTKMLCIPRNELLMLCDAYPDLGYQVMHNLAIDLAHKIRNTNQANLTF